MAPAKPAQSNAMLYTLVTFITLFLISTVLAIVFYVKTEDFRIIAEDAKKELSAVASDREQASLSKIVGKPDKGASYLGTVNTYLNEMVSIITGQMPEAMTASAKRNDVIVKVNETMQLLGETSYTLGGTQGISLLESLNDMAAALDEANARAELIENQMNSVQEDFDQAVADFRVEEQQLIKEKDRFQESYDAMQTEFDQLQQMMEDSASDQVAIYADKLDSLGKKFKQLNIDMLKKENELSKTRMSLQLALKKIEEIKPRPDIEMTAFVADASIIQFDQQNDLIYLDKGSNAKVYRGLTFSVYDKNAPIPEDGKGKAEIEVFSVDTDSSVAKINYSTKSRPIAKGDIVANLIWDTNSSNVFVVAGDFDFDGDGHVDYNGTKKIKQLIERWGGVVADKVTIDTDFVVVGTAPKAMKKPTREQLEIDPDSESKYEASLTRVARYNDVMDKTTLFSVPVFNKKRFMHLTGYNMLATLSTPQ